MIDPHVGGTCRNYEGFTPECALRGDVVMSETPMRERMETLQLDESDFIGDTPVRPALLTISDPTDVIFDGIYGLTFAKGSAEAAEMCAETLARALSARSVVIHAHDLTTGELRAIGAHGDGDFDILGSAEASEDDIVASAVLCNGKSITLTFDGDLPRMAPKRLHAVGAPRTVVAAPAMAWGRCLGIIEVIDADERYSERVADAASYVADHFAQFLSARAA